MKTATNSLLLFAAFVVLFVPLGCDYGTRIDRLEQDSRLLQGRINEQARQRESVDADVAQQLSVINEHQDSTDQRLEELETEVADLSISLEVLRQQISDIDSQLDDRAINWALKYWLTYAVAVVILLIGIFIGVWGHRFKVRSDLAREANLANSDETSDRNGSD